MTGFRPSPDFIPGDGLEPHVELSRDNPLWVPELPDAGREGVDFKTAYDAGRQLTEAGPVALIPSIHASLTTNEGVRNLGDE